MNKLKIRKSVEGRILRHVVLDVRNLPWLLPKGLSKQMK